MAEYTSRQRIPVWAVAGIALVVTMITTRPLQTRASFLVPQRHHERPAMVAQTASSSAAAAPAFVSSPATSSYRTSGGGSNSGNSGGSSGASTALLMTEEPEIERPTTFREAEVLGLKRMQEGNYEDALKAFQKGLQLPGSRQDVVRTKLLSGPSPVGGSTGGMESRNIESLDEYELQAAHYNMACAHAQLGNLQESIFALQTAFENGFDNFSTVRGDKDLDPIKQEKEFEKLMEAYEPKKGGFNPFGLFGGGAGGSKK